MAAELIFPKDVALDIFRTPPRVDSHFVLQKTTVFSSYRSIFLHIIEHALHIILAVYIVLRMCQSLVQVLERLCNCYSQRQSASEILSDFSSNDLNLDMGHHQEITSDTDSISDSGAVLLSQPKTSKIGVGRGNH